MQNSSLIVYAKLGVLALLWASAFPAMAILAENGFGADVVVFLRIFLAAIALVIIMKMRKIDFPMSARFWFVSALLGLLGDFVANYLLAFSTSVIDVSLVSIILGASPILTLLILWGYPKRSNTSRDKITKLKVFGLVLGFIGITIGSYPELNTSQIGTLGVVATLLAAVCYSGVNLLSKFGDVYDGFALSAASMLIFSIPMAPFVWDDMLQIRELIWSLEVIAAIFFLSIFATAIAFVLMINIATNHGAIVLSYSNYLVPLFGAILGVSILGETITLEKSLGFVLIIIGVFLIFNEPKE